MFLCLDEVVIFIILYYLFFYGKKETETSGVGDLLKTNLLIVTNSEQQAY